MAALGEFPTEQGSISGANMPAFAAIPTGHGSLGAGNSSRFVRSAAPMSPSKILIGQFFIVLSIIVLTLWGVVSV